MAFAASRRLQRRVNAVSQSVPTGGEKYIENRDETHSNTLVKRRSEINNVLRKNKQIYTGVPKP